MSNKQLNYLINRIDVKVASFVSPSTEIKQKVETLPLGTCAYHGLYDFSETHTTYSGSDYSGVFYPAFGYLILDFDSKLDATQENYGADALSDARRFVLSINSEHTRVAFSGGKGFHVYLPAAFLGVEPSRDYPSQVKCFLKKLQTKFPTLDPAVSDNFRKIRALNSKHESGRYKRFIDPHWDIHKIRAHCKDRQDLDAIPTLPDTLGPIEMLASVMRETQEYSQPTYLKPTAVLPTVTEKQTSTNPGDVFEEGVVYPARRKNPKVKAPHGSYKRVMNEISACFNKDLCITDTAYRVYEKDKKHHEIPYFSKEGGHSDAIDSDPIKNAVLLTEKLFARWKKEKEKSPSDDEIAHLFLTQHVGCNFDLKTGTYKEGNIKQEGKDTFLFDGKMWVRLGSSKLEDPNYGKLSDAIRIPLCNALRKLPKTPVNIDNRIDAILKHLQKTLIPKIRNQSFYDNPFHIRNFLNGTVECDINDKENPFHFKEHDKNDHLTQTLHFNFSERWKDESYVNPYFEEALNNTMVDEDLKPDDEKRMALQEAFGVSFFNVFPRIVFYDGASSTGKSTFIKILSRIVGEENISRQQPYKWSEDFGLESMINKIININAELKTNAPISEDILKQIEDMEKIAVNRKHLSVVQAKLPPVHHYAYNTAPKILEGGAGGAYSRRITLIKMHRVLEEDRFFFNNMLPRDSDGQIKREFIEPIFNWGLRGLYRLIQNNGKFTKPKSSIDELKRQQNEGDILSEFVELINAGGLEEDFFITQTDSKEDTVTTKMFYKIFKLWCEKEIGSRTPIRPGTFTSRLRSNKYVEFSRKMTKGYFRVLGYRVEVGQLNVKYPE